MLNLVLLFYLFYIFIWVILVLPVELNENEKWYFGNKCTVVFMLYLCFISVKVHFISNLKTSFFFVVLVKKLDLLSYLLCTE